MKPPSSERILTTHTGSLPRPPELLELYVAAAEGREPDAALAAERTRAAVADAVSRQVAAGIDIPSDGEMGKIGFANYVLDRMTGFGGDSRPFLPRDVLDYPSLAERLYGGDRALRMRRPANDGEVRYVGEEQLRTDLANLRDALADVGFAGAFMPAASPGCVVQIMPSTHYGSRRDYLFALAEALRVEYRAIVDAGFLVQVDCPDLAMMRHVEMADASLEEFRALMAMHVEALNYGLEGIDPSRARVHVCWGNYAGPHHRDVALRDILDVIYQVRAAGISIEAANPRHEHEWAVFRDMPLPLGRYLIPGVIDSVSNCIEHPELVAQRIVRFAGVVGRENVVAGTDCGFSTFAGWSAVLPDIAYAKLASLAEGARLASARLWP